MRWEGCSTPASEHAAKTYLYDESGSTLLDESRLETVLDSAEDAVWLVPAIALSEADEDHRPEDQSIGIPTKDQLECHHCDGETEHRFHPHEPLPDETWSGQPIWECQEGGACRYGPEPR